LLDEKGEAELFGKRVPLITRGVNYRPPLLVEHDGREGGGTNKGDEVKKEDRIATNRPEVLWY